MFCLKVTGIEVVDFDFSVVAASCQPTKPNTKHILTKLVSSNVVLEAGGDPFFQLIPQ